ncbi:hypothetical protein ABGV42_00370 [Paenibacillus pabuli]|uniref:hypothetical protein n=1 Tax=Paenibacillus pabuli TaxID=1472 RepID=UPI0032421B0A
MTQVFDNVVNEMLVSLENLNQGDKVAYEIYNRELDKFHIFTGVLNNYHHNHEYECIVVILTKDDGTQWEYTVTENPNYYSPFILTQICKLGGELIGSRTAE